MRWFVNGSPSAMCVSSPTSRSIFVNERWSNTKPAPSVPRITFVTGSHLAVCGWSNMLWARSA